LLVYENLPSAGLQTHCLQLSPSKGGDLGVVEQSPEPVSQTGLVHGSGAVQTVRVGQGQHLPRREAFAIGHWILFLVHPCTGSQEYV